MRYTENLLLKKPDLADSPPDITVFNDNWDKIDEKLKKLPVQNGGLYINSDTTEEDKEEATTALKNLSALVQSGANAFVNPVSDLNNFQTGIGLFTDKTANIPSGDTWWSVFSSGAKSLGTVLQIAFSLNKLIIKWRSMRAGGWIDWQDSGYLPLDGSVSMSGNLGIERSVYPALHIKDPTVGRRLKNEVEPDGSIAIVNDDGTSENVTYLNLRKETTTLAELFRLVVIKEGTSASYNIFGEHNTELLASTIQSLIDSGVIEVGGFKSPIKSQSFSLTKGESASGTGKGKLFVGTKSSSYPATVVIDGVSMSIASISYSPAVEFEFTKSWVVNGPNGSTEYVAGTAVFYE